MVSYSVKENRRGMRVRWMDKERREREVRAWGEGEVGRRREIVSSSEEPAVTRSSNALLALLRCSYDTVRRREISFCH